MRRTWWILAHVLPGSLACGSGEPSEPAATVRDSAGVVIVTSRGPVWASREGWRVAEAPSVRIGSLDGPPGSALHDVVGVVRLSDGGVVIGDAGSRALRFYAPTGRHLRDVGGRGEGPGEFARLDALHRFAGDSLLAFDTRLHRVSVFDPGGTFARSFRLEGAVAFPEFPFGDGRLAATTRDLVPRGALESGVNVDSTTVLAFSAEGLLLDTLGRFPTPETYIWAEGGEVMVVPYPFARVVAVGPAPSGFYSGSSDVYEIRVHAASGRLERIVRRDVRRPAGRADLDRFVEEVLAEARSDAHRAQLQRAFAAMEVRETLPAFTDLLLDAEGCLWVRAYRRAGEERADWDVFDPEGRWLGTVGLPAELDVHEIGPDYVLGVSRDHLGVERVGLYELVRIES